MVREDVKGQKILELLDAVNQKSAHTQRTLSKELGIALGLTNGYLRRCIRKGWIKAKRAPVNRYAYYLTPKGFAEKSRLTAGFLARSFRFYGEARDQLDDAFAVCAAQGWRRVALMGAGELAEIALLCAIQHPIEVAGVADARHSTGTFRHVRIEPELAKLGRIDAVIITDLSAPQAAFDALAADHAPERILTPALLKITRGAGASEVTR